MVNFQGLFKANSNSRPFQGTAPNSRPFQACANPEVILLREMVDLHGKATVMAKGLGR